MRPRLLFPVTIGLSDGIITSLMIAASRMAEPSSVSAYFALRVAAGSAIVGMFSFFVAEYSRLRNELSRSSRQLGYPSPSFLLRTRLGRSILVEAITGTSASGVSGFTGALIPLAAAAFTLSPYAPFLAAFVSLVLLGIGLARAVSGSYITWPTGMLALGILMALVGMALHIT
ncbi:hypothetical protein GCM10007108_12940 [Thermogymnomonas acidicola]|uniref:VIT family protein n=1 Tax=Thermogymnomonas acidicola TaxID=399579 RepID=A0AA37BRW2_9ARCH|nr:hypothetical protein [Thermogymnomonas acidicola]GGM76425.1 hypothetical protein GCM10007108_12940 [Thermogymnomonas acidicola]